MDLRSSLLRTLGSETAPSSQSFQSTTARNGYFPPPVGVPRETRRRRSWLRRRSADDDDAPPVRTGPDAEAPWPSARAPTDNSDRRLRRPGACHSFIIPTKDCASRKSGHGSREKRFRIQGASVWFPPSFDFDDSNDFLASVRCKGDSRSHSRK
jgi:hypothetical protein